MTLPDGALPLAVGTVLALGGLSLVLSPLLGDTTTPSATETASTRRQSERDAAANVAVNGAVAALREIEFDRETGKLSDADYALLKQRYTQAAIDEMRSAKSASAQDPVEAAIARAHAQQQSCDECGPRAEPDAAYCSNCGRYLAGCCANCGARVEVASSTFCSNCGEHLAEV